MRRLGSILASLALVFSSLFYVPSASAAGPAPQCQPDGIPIADYTASDWTGVGPHTIQFDASVRSEGCGDSITSYAWNFGDGSSSTDATTSHTFSAGTWQILLTVTDEAGQNDTVTSDLSVRASNAAPVAGDDAFVYTSLSTPYYGSISSNDTDADDTWLHYSVVTAPAHGSVNLDLGSYFIYTPEVGFSGQDSFTYIASDNYGGVSNVATVSLTIPSSTPVDPEEPTDPENPPAPTNTAPVAADDTAYAYEDTPKTIHILGNDYDADNDTLTATLTSVPENTGTLTLNPDQSVLYTPAPNFYGTTSFDYSVSDGKGGQSSARATIVLTALNDAPVAANDTASTTEDTAVTLNVLTNDTDVDSTLNTTTIASQPAHGTLASLGGGLYRYTPNANFYGSDSFSYRAVDSSGSTSSVSTVSLTIAAVNDAPVSAFSTTIGKARLVTFTNQSSDIDSTPLSYSWNFGDGSTSTSTSPSHSYARKGTYVVTLAVTDAAGATTIVSKTISI